MPGIPRPCIALIAAASLAGAAATAAGAGVVVQAVQHDGEPATITVAVSGGPGDVGAAFARVDDGRPCEPTPAALRAASPDAAVLLPESPAPAAVSWSPPDPGTVRVCAYVTGAGGSVSRSETVLTVRGVAASSGPSILPVTPGRPWLARVVRRAGRPVVRWRCPAAPTTAPLVVTVRDRGAGSPATVAMLTGSCRRPVLSLAAEGVRLVRGEAALVVGRAAAGDGARVQVTQGGRRLASLG